MSLFHHFAQTTITSLFNGNSSLQSPRPSALKKDNIQTRNRKMNKKSVINNNVIKTEQPSASSSPVLDEVNNGEAELMYKRQLQLMSSWPAAYNEMKL